jgi:predicted small secreted protein
MPSLKKLLVLAASGALLTSPLLTGCNTVEGIGKDVKKAGEKIQDVATDDKKK